VKKVEDLAGTMDRNNSLEKTGSSAIPVAPGSRDMDPGSAGEGEDIIRIEHISKIFKGKKTVFAVNDVSFNVKRGEIFGLLGPNGAGKSTLIRILTTLMKPTSGTAWIDTFEVTRDDEEVRSIIGVCPQNSTLDVELTAYDNLSFYGKLVNVDEDHLEARIWDLLKMSGLSDRAYSKVGTFSGGMKRKLEIVRAFIHHPLILFLDEPTIGLDPESRREVWGQISVLNTEKTTIILTTHYMDEAEKLCQRIAFMDQGRLMALDTPDNLKRSMPVGELIELGVENFNDAVLPVIRSHDLVISVDMKDGKMQISAKNGSSLLPAVIADCDRFGITITTISIRSPSLEDVFLSVTGKNLDHQGTDEPVRSPGRR
jgi:ABC-2 type transport system ATP-binding protein